MLTDANANKFNVWGRPLVHSVEKRALTTVVDVRAKRLTHSKRHDFVLAEEEFTPFPFFSYFLEFVISHVLDTDDEDAGVSVQGVLNLLYNVLLQLQSFLLSSRKRNLFFSL